MDVEAINRFMAEQFPSAADFGARLDSVGGRAATVHLDVDERHLRPGETVSGPTLMTLADMTTYFALMGELGTSVTGAVTTHLGIHFFHRASLGRLVAEAELVKLGRRSAVAEVRINSANAQGPIAHATVSYALPSVP
jgi:uncharacterized protein (TIGR00369 family)